MINFLFVLHKLIDFCFDGGDNKYIVIKPYGAKWVKEHRNNQICFNKQKIKEAVTYLLSNCYFYVGSKILRQIIGTPMGSDPAPFFANLFLYYYESKWINEIKRNDLIRARKLCNIFGFIDNLNIFNDNGEFETNWNDIYPAELE